MNLLEAKQVLRDNGYELYLEEGFFSDLKDKVVNKVKNYFSYNEWIREVTKILKEKYRLLIDDLKGVINFDCFKKCYNNAIKPINFVKGLMKKYVEEMSNRATHETEDEDELEYNSITPEPVYEAYKLISESWIK